MNAALEVVLIMLGLAALGVAALAIAACIASSRVSQLEEGRHYLPPHPEAASVVDAEIRRLEEQVWRREYDGPPPAA